MNLHVTGRVKKTRQCLRTEVVVPLRDIFSFAKDISNFFQDFEQLNY